MFITKTTLYNVSPTIFYHFSGNFIILFYKSFLLLFLTNVSRCILQTLKFSNFFFERNFIGIVIRDNRMVQYLTSMTDEVKYLIQTQFFTLLKSREENVFSYFSFLIRHNKR